MCERLSLTAALAPRKQVTDADSRLIREQRTIFATEIAPIVPLVSTLEPPSTFLAWRRRISVAEGACDIALATRSRSRAPLDRGTASRARQLEDLTRALSPPHPLTSPPPPRLTTPTRRHSISQTPIHPAIAIDTSDRRRRLAQVSSLAVGLPVLRCEHCRRVESWLLGLSRSQAWTFSPTLLPSSNFSTGTDASRTEISRNPRSSPPQALPRLVRRCACLRPARPRSTIPSHIHRLQHQGTHHNDQITRPTRQ